MNLEEWKIKRVLTTLAIFCIGLIPFFMIKIFG